MPRAPGVFGTISPPPCSASRTTEKKKKKTLRKCVSQKTSSATTVCYYGRYCTLGKKSKGRANGHNVIRARTRIDRRVFFCRPHGWIRFAWSTRLKNHEYSFRAIHLDSELTRRSSNRNRNIVLFRSRKRNRRDHLAKSQKGFRWKKKKVLNNIIYIKYIHEYNLHTYGVVACSSTCSSTGVSHDCSCNGLKIMPRYSYTCSSIKRC